MRAQLNVILYTCHGVCVNLVRLKCDRKTVCSGSSRNMPTVSLAVSLIGLMICCTWSHVVSTVGSRLNYLFLIKGTASLSEEILRHAFKVKV